MAGKTLDEEAIFKVACRISATDARSEYLQQVCGDNETLLSRLKTMLDLHFFDRSFLEHPASNAVASLDVPILTEPIGSEIGPYKLRDQLAEGGMGVVYIAEQIRPVQRKVALKVIKPGMDTRQVIARFEAERQALALMDHPNIAQVFDGGVTESGHPFFVMELVHGVSITEFCDQYQYSVEQRLELFMDVCRAIQHAHQKGIIHRDIKSSNVLVTLHDDKPLVKVIDFGIAKAINQEHVQHTMHTRFAQMLGTPAYMSPEQAELRPLGIDTRSDVYSLGVLLYELLTGTTPIDAQHMESSSYDELRRIIRDEEPPRPSARISTLGAELATTVAQQRRTVTVRLSQRLRGELDSIVLKCLEKDRTRRYETASALADDVHRFLKNEPIMARSPSTPYRIHKFVRRNRLLVSSLAAVFLALSLGVTAATVAFLHAGQQRDLAENRLADITKEQENNRVLIQLLRDMYPTPWGVQTLGRNHTVYEAIEAISPTLKTRLQNHPEVEIKVRQIFADAYKSAKEFDKEREHLEKALNLAQQIYQGRPHPMLAEIHAQLADAVGSNVGVPHDFARLLKHAETAIAMNAALGIESGRSYDHAWFAKGQCLLRTSPNRKAEAEQAQRNVVEARERLGQNPSLAVWDLGLVLMELGDDRLDDAQAEFERALENCQDGSRPMVKSTALSGLGTCLNRKGNLTGAIKALRESWTLCQTNDKLRNEPRGHRSATWLVEVYFAQSDLQAAFELVEQVERYLRTTETSPVESLVECLFLKGWLYYQLEHDDLAVELLTESRDLARDHFGEQSILFAGPCVYLALLLERSQQSQNAEAAFRRYLPITEAFVNASPSYSVCHWSHTRGLVATSGGDVSKLENALEIADRGHQFVAEWRRKWMEPAFYYNKARLQLQLDESNPQTAIELLKSGLMKAREPQATYRSWRWHVPTMRTELETMLARLYLQEDRAEQAMRVLRDAISIRSDALGDDHIQTAMAQLRLGEFLVTHSERFEIVTAEQPLRKAYEKLTRHPPAVNALRRRAARSLAEVYRATERPRNADQWQAIAESHGRPKPENDTD